MRWTEYPQNLKVRLVTSFFNRAVTSAVMPFMALFFAQEINQVWAGTFLISTVCISFFVNLFGGYLSDRYPRKIVLVVSSLASASMFLIMTLSLYPTDKMIVLFAFAYVGFVITSSLGRPAMNALIMDSTTPDNRKAVYAVDYWLVNLSLAIGTALGGLLYVQHQLELFITLTITSFCLPIVYQIWLRDEHIPQAKPMHANLLIDVFQNYKIAFQDWPFVKVVLGSMLIFAAEFSLNSYIGVRLAESFETFTVGAFEISGVRMLSILNIENMLLVVCFTFLINRFTDRFNKQNVLLIGLIIYSIGYTFLMSATSWQLLLLFGLIATVGELIYSPVRNAEQANMIPTDKRGSYSAFSNISFSGADLIARSTIIIGAYLLPSMMSVYIGILLMIGIFLIYTGLFLRQAGND